MIDQPFHRVLFTFLTLSGLAVVGAVLLGLFPSESRATSFRIDSFSTAVGRAWSSMDTDQHGVAHVVVEHFEMPKYVIMTQPRFSETIPGFFEPMHGTPEFSLDIDDQGNPHVVYHWNDYMDERLYYQSKVDGSWSGQGLVVPSEDSTFRELTIKVDSHGTRHLLFHSFAYQPPLRYLTRSSGGSWEEQLQIDALADADLSIGGTSLPRIVYVTTSNNPREIKYLRLENDGGGPVWYVDTFPTTSNANVSLAMFGPSIPHVALYSGITSPDLSHGTKTIGPWDWTDVDTNGDVGLESSIAVDSQGDPHICYYEADTGDVKYAHRTGDTWTVETLEAGTDTSPRMNTSIAVDVFDAPHMTYYVPGSGVIRYASAQDCNHNGINDRDEIDSGAEDCNGNGILDECDLLTGLDCNGNGIPDACDIADGVVEDCNGNGVPDECDISDGTSQDCNTNGIPDECDPDCNENDIPDECDIEDGISLDCNRNDIPDECDFADGTSQDCNGNGIPDECDITYGGMPDCDKNGVPDECDFASGDPVDCNGNMEIDLCELPDAWHVGGQEYGSFGWAVASGDFDADGFTDIAVGQPAWSGAKGRVHVFYGGDPMDTVADEVMTWNNSGDQYGQSLATGNINGDAYDDLVIGIPGYLDYYGVVIVFTGTAEADLTYLDSWAGHQTFSNFGASVALADVTGDGLEDVIVGAPAQNTNQDPGHAYVYDATSLSGNPIETWDGYENDDDFGSSVANAGDVDGNGLDDVIIGTGFYGTNSGLVGYARLFLSQPGGMVEGPALGTGVAGDLYGYAVNTAGDLNDDGFDDFIVGAPYSGVYGDRPGRAFLYFGSDNPDGTADLVFEGAEHLADLGSAVAPAGDVNADGFPDLIISSDHLHNGGEYSWVDLFFGGPHLDGEADKRIFSEYRGYGMGWAVASGGDSDGDGIQEVLIGHPQHSSGEFFSGRTSLFQLSLPDFGDCNLNGVTDVCDISSGASSDGNGNGIPDECEGISGIGDTAPPARTMLLGAYPSPFNPRTEIAFEVGAPTSVSLKVYDVSGRLIRTLVRGDRFDTGRHTVTWQGRDNSGGQVAAGVYFYRFEAGGHSDVGRVALVK